MNEWLGARNRGLDGRPVNQLAVATYITVPGCSMAILATDSNGVNPGIAVHPAQLAI